jgi:hypothetical protein
MEYIINELKEYPFSGHDILSACDDTKIVLYSDIHKFKTLDDLLRPHNSVVILYQLKQNFGHWVLLFKYPNSNTVEFFCSYGIFVDDQLKFINPDFRKKSFQDFPYLTKLLVDSGYKIVVNNVKLQQKKNDISSCGRHVCSRLIFKNLPLKNYIDIIKNNKYDPDSVVTYLTAFV